ncbi:MBL fold metallo-hydrolase [Arcticibacter eurypsychrophilus]|uniref:MBL fold metallo-hydrolase n=1 Tax=Arcticibacter eurypsychrophilus TaxID=1434752 RepID=UPI00084D159B|nr:MBL fold metallo-hydrolase [Arcticibacter eurypsychrophilus]
MSVSIASINSGSNGNCYYVGNQEGAVLIDAGISCKEIELRMNRLGLAMKSVKAIFVSHEHSDHIRGIDVLSRKYQIPVYLNLTMIHNGCVRVEKELVKVYEAHIPVTIGNMQITAFPKFHDACDPHSFIIQSENVTIGVLTDIGKACEQVIKYFKLCDAVFLEANYDEEMLQKGSYPYYLKNRIRSDKGHLSNTEALNLFVNHKSALLSHLLLSHLSKDNNSPDLVSRLFNVHAQHTKVVVASRSVESEIYQISGADSTLLTEIVVKDKLTQYSLF